MIDNIEKAVEILNEKRWRDRDDWRVRIFSETQEPLCCFSDPDNPEDESNFVGDRSIQLDPPDAIAIANWLLVSASPGVALWECPECCFAFDAAHVNSDGSGYTCPACEVERLERFVADTVEGFSCLPTCDSTAHDELCPVANPIEAWRQLRVRIAELERENAKTHGRLGCALQELKQIKSGWESEEKYKQIAKSRAGDRRTVMRRMMKQKAQLATLQAALKQISEMTVPCSRELCMCCGDETRHEISEESHIAREALATLQSGEKAEAGK